MNTIWANFREALKRVAAKESLSVTDPRDEEFLRVYSKSFTYPQAWVVFTEEIDHIGFSFHRKEAGFEDKEEVFGEGRILHNKDGLQLKGSIITGSLTSEYYSPDEAAEILLKRLHELIGE